MAVSYRDFMPNVNPLLNVIKRFTDFTLPVSQLRKIGTRAASEALTNVRPQQRELQNVRNLLRTQRSTALNQLAAQRSLIPQMLNQQIQQAIAQADAAERQRGAVSSTGLRIQDILGLAGQAQAETGQTLMNIANQQTKVEQNYLSDLFSQVYAPQRELAAKQGSDAAKRYHTYYNQAVQALYEGRVNQAEQLLNKAQREYQALQQARLNEYQKWLANMQQKMANEMYKSTMAVAYSEAKGVPYASLINKYAKQYGVNPTLVARVIRAESNFNPYAVSPAGAQGLMQLMPATARGLGVKNPFDPAQNIKGGVKYLAAQLDRWNGNVALALASYNAGPGNVQKWVRQAGTTDWNVVKRYAFRETRNYVDKILGS